MKWNHQCFFFPLNILFTFLTCEIGEQKKQLTNTVPLGGWGWLDTEIGWDCKALPPGDDDKRSAGCWTTK